MRVLIVFLVAAAGLSAQAAESEAAVKLRQFGRNLQNAMRPSGLKASITLAGPPAARVCAIPLLKVGPDPSFHSNMPTIAPDPNTKFAARELVPPAPTCGEPEKK
jgi:hypothetical protein